MAVLKPPKINNDNLVSHEWRCLYCGNINRLVDRSCNGCGAQRAFILDETPNMSILDFENIDPYKIPVLSRHNSQNYGISVPHSEQKDLVLPSGTSRLDLMFNLTEDGYKEFASFVANNYKFFSTDEMRELFWRHFGR